MDEIVKLVAKKTGMNEAVAQIAVTTVLSAVKTKLPANVGSILDSVIGGGKTTSKSKNDNPLGDLGSIAGTLGGLLGGKKK